MEADWIGKKEKRFNWLRLRYEYGRWHYATNCCGETIKQWFIVESTPTKSRKG